MNANMSNGKFWIPVIIGLFTAFSGVTFGLIKAEQARNQLVVKEQIVELERKMAEQNVRVYDVASRISVLENMMRLYHAEGK